MPYLGLEKEAKPLKFHLFMYTFIFTTLRISGNLPIYGTVQIYTLSDLICLLVITLKFPLASKKFLRAIYTFSFRFYLVSETCKVMHWNGKSRILGSVVIFGISVGVGKFPILESESIGSSISLLNLAWRTLLLSYQIKVLTFRDVYDFGEQTAQLKSFQHS